MSHLKPTNDFIFKKLFGEPIDDNITYHYIQLPKFLEQTKEIKTKEEQWLAYITNSLNK